MFLFREKASSVLFNVYPVNSRSELMTDSFPPFEELALLTKDEMETAVAEGRYIPRFENDDEYMGADHRVSKVFIEISSSQFDLDTYSEAFFMLMLGEVPVVAGDPQTPKEYIENNFFDFIETALAYTLRLYIVDLNESEIPSNKRQNFIKMKNFVLDSILKELQECRVNRDTKRGKLELAALLFTTFGNLAYYDYLTYKDNLDSVNTTPVSGCIPSAMFTAYNKSERMVRFANILSQSKVSPAPFARNMIGGHPAVVEFEKSPSDEDTTQPPQ